MTEQEIYEKLRAIVEEYADFEAEQYTPEAKFMDDLGLNSYDFMSVAGEIEEVFDIDINEREMMKVVSVKDAVAYIVQAQE